MQLQRPPLPTFRNVAHVTETSSPTNWLPALHSQSPKVPVALTGLFGVGSMRISCAQWTALSVTVAFVIKPSCVRGVRPYATTQQVCACACSMHTFPYEPAGQTEGRRTHTRRAVQFPVPPSTLRRASANVAHDAMRNSTTRNTVRLHQISTDDRSQQCSAHSGYIDALCPLAPDYTWADEGRATDLLGSWWP